VILAIETSCDDTCAAVVDAAGTIRSNVISSQGIHDRYGGVVPEIAARHHLELVDVAVEDALAQAATTLDDIDLVAVTQGPGLVGALLIGLSEAKALAAARGLPLAAVDHLQGHVAANFLGPEPFEPPFLCLIASGGHTLLAHVTEHHGYEVLGATLDDAAGEAFDKGARMLGLGYPGGPALSRLAEAGDPHAHAFPTADGVAGLDFSFAGIKTALLYALRDRPDADSADLAASYQRALAQTGLTRLAIGGGVAANTALRERLATLGVDLHVPPRELCTDNAAMIASAARYVEALEPAAYLGLDAYATGQAPADVVRGSGDL
jgi:N6-L-threonylcarbamoyladenine synthase